MACFGEMVGLGQAGQEPGDVWAVVAERPAGLPARATFVGQFTIVRLNKAALDGRIVAAPLDRDLATSAPVILSLPMADGSFSRFRVADSPILAPALAAAFPEFRTYTGQGIDDPTATTRFGWTAAGFHAIVVAASGTTYIDPYAAGNVELYTVANKGNVQRPALPFICEVPGAAGGAQRPLNEFPITNGTSLRTYRLAMAATVEYTAAAGGTKPAALSRIVASVNRVNGIYERELAVRFTLATGTPGDPTALIYTGDPLADPYTNSSGSTMLGQNQTNIDMVVGSANYDFGHVFSTGGGGIASVGSICSTANKARGVTGLSNPVGDGFDVDYVAHEMGHQFAGNHTFNSVSSNCSGNRSATNASEVGSGSTIQAYAGICPPEDLQPHSDDYFTVQSLNQMTAFITSQGGSTCGVVTATGNTVPSVTAGGSYTIPVSTPFTLTASGSDANGDALTYDWEQHSLNGSSTNSVVSASTDSGTNPIVRSYLPTTSPSRTFPKLAYILNNGNVPPSTYACSSGTCLTGEILPATNRTITFHVTARDNRAGGGAIATASTLVTSTTAAGPFSVTSPNTGLTVAGGMPATITWNVANTAAAPVNAANVRILLSTDGGSTFPTVLVASTPNDGSESVTMTNVASTQARIRVEAVGNIFFDVSNANFTITVSPLFSFTDDPLSSGITPIRVVHLTELRNAVNTQRSRFGLPAAVWTDPSLVAGVTPARAVHILELRTALNAAYAAAGRTAPTYSRTLTAGATVISAIDVAELRAAINGL
jgi:hypothetical protein